MIYTILKWFLFLYCAFFPLQVFEANIRVLGGLLAAHLLIEDEKNTFGDLEPDW